jgi:hypothetical protein
MDELIARLESYLNGSLTLDAFEQWFYDLAFDIEKRDCNGYMDLVHRIEGILAESSHGGWTNETLRAELSSLLEEYSEPVGVWEINEPYRPAVKSRSSGMLVGLAPVWR